MLSDMLPWAGLIFGGSGLIVAVLNAITGREGRRAEVAASAATAARDSAEATAREHEIWFEEANAAYKRIAKECESCNAKLMRLNNRFYALIDALDDLCHTADDHTVRVVELRSVVRAARTEPGRNHAPPGPDEG